MPKTWDKCVKSSNWFGAKGEKRAMNMLSPSMSTDDFRDRFEEAKFCDTSIHGIDHYNLFLSNTLNGENYSIYNSSQSWTINDTNCNTMISRLNYLRSKEYGIILWLMTDGVRLTNFQRYCDDLKSKNFFKYASVIVLGCNFNTYCSSDRIPTLVNILRNNNYTGKIGIHLTKLEWNNTSQAIKNWNTLKPYYDNVDIVFLEVAQNIDNHDLRSIIRTILRTYDFQKYVYMFNLDKFPNRHKCIVAENAGAYACGNWRNSYFKRTEDDDYEEDDWDHGGEGGGEESGDDGSKFYGPGYGRVNYWGVSSTNSLPNIATEMDKMQEYNLKCYVIELTGPMRQHKDCWRSNYYSDAWYNEVAAKYKVLLELCEAHGLWLLTIMVNANVWEKHYLGPTQDEVRRMIRDIIVPGGHKDNVVICPINEPRDSDRPFESELLATLKDKGFTTCSFGPPKKANADYWQEGHADNIDVAGKEYNYSGNFAVTDSTGVIKELYGKNNIEDITGSRCVQNKADAKKLASNYKKVGHAQAVMLYAHTYGKGGVSKVDENAIIGMSEGWYEGSGDKAKPWDQCTKSSNWFGENAEERIMNILSPHMDSDDFKERYDDSCGRDGIDHFNLFVCNQGDGEYSGYSIYGNGVSGSINKQYCDTMLSRIRYIRNHGYGIILWLMADNSETWNEDLYKKWNQYCKDLKSKGFFSYASVVVVGLEINEWWNDPAKTNYCCNVLRNHYSGKIGVHTTSGVYSRYFSKADIPFLQINPGSSDSAIEDLIQNAKNANPKKPIYMFEMERHPDNDRCGVAFDAGAYAVGNW